MVVFLFTNIHVPPWWEGSAEVFPLQTNHVPASITHDTRNACGAFFSVAFGRFRSGLFFKNKHFPGITHDTMHSSDASFSPAVKRVRSGLPLEK